MASVMAEQMFFGSEETEMFFSPTLVPPLPPSAEMCFDQDPPDTAFLLSAGVEEAQKLEAKVYLERRQVLAGQAQPKEQTVGTEGTTAQSVMAA